MTTKIQPQLHTVPQTNKSAPIVPFFYHLVGVSMVNNSCAFLQVALGLLSIMICQGEPKGERQEFECCGVQRIDGQRLSQSEFYKFVGKGQPFILQSE
jgi:hypothetical protein